MLVTCLSVVAACYLLEVKTGHSHTDKLQWISIGHDECLRCLSPRLHFQSRCKIGPQEKYPTISIMASKHHWLKRRHPFAQSRGQMSFAAKFARRNLRGHARSFVLINSGVVIDHNHTPPKSASIAIYWSILPILNSTSWSTSTWSWLLWSHFSPLCISK